MLSQQRCAALLAPCLDGNARHIQNAQRNAVGDMPTLPYILERRPFPTRTDLGLKSEQAIEKRHHSKRGSSLKCRERELSPQGCHALGRQLLRVGIEWLQWRRRTASAFVVRTAARYRHSAALRESGTSLHDSDEKE